MALIADGRVFEGQTYMFINKAYPNRALNVWCSSSYPATNQSNVCLWTKDTTDTAQHWVIDRIGTTNYILKPVENPAKALDLYTGTGTGANANAQLYTPSETSYLEFDVGGYSDTVHIKLAGTTNNGYFLTAYSNANGTRTGKSNTSAGNVFFQKYEIFDDRKEWIPVPIGTTSGGGDNNTNGQRLIMPINQSRITVSYKSNAPAYHEQGFSDPTHYGVDMVGTPRDFFASGDGTIVGYRAVDGGSLGKWLAVRYNNVIDIHGNNIGDVVFRYCHLDDIYKTSGEVHVDDASPMARYGSTGTGASFPHLHMEVDTDVEHPNKTPSLSGSSNGLVSGKNNDTTIDPFEIFYKRISDDEDKNQTVTPSQSYCDISNCSVCATQYPQYENGRVPYVNEAQCYGVPVLPE